MNDWTKETAEAYTTMAKREHEFTKRKKDQFTDLRTGEKILFYNHATHRDEWGIVNRIVPTTAHTGYVVTENGKRIWAGEIKIVHRETQAETLQICLNDRLHEFRAAASRAADFRMLVFADWDKDNFVVVNVDTKSEYKVALQTRANRVFSSCECRDFSRRSRVCKHVTEVLKECFAPHFEELNAALEAESEIEAWAYVHEVI